MEREKTFARSSRADDNLVDGLIEVDDLQRPGNVWLLDAILDLSFLESKSIYYFLHAYILMHKN